MSQSEILARVTNRVLVNIMLIAVLVTFGHAQVRTENTCADVSKLEPISYLRCFGLDFFPSFAGRSIDMRIAIAGAYDISPTQRDQSYSVRLQPESRGSDTLDKPEYVDMLFLFGRDGIMQVNVLRSGPDPVDRVREEFRQHAEWSNTELADALNSVGARFGPGKEAEFKKAVPLTKLRKYLGDVKLTAVQFVIHRSDGPRALDFEWDCELTGRSRKYHVWFSPLDGSLSTITRVVR